MSTPEQKVASAVSQVETTVVAEAKAWYAKVSTYLMAGGGLVVGWLVGHYL